MVGLKERTPKGYPSVGKTFLFGAVGWDDPAAAEEPHVAAAVSHTAPHREFAMNPRYEL